MAYNGAIPAVLKFEIFQAKKNKVSSYGFYIGFLTLIYKTYLSSPFAASKAPENRLAKARYASRRLPALRKKALRFNPLSQRRGLPKQSFFESWSLGNFPWFFYY